MDPSNATTPAQLAIIDLLEHARKVIARSLTYVSCVATVLVWDWLVTLPQEYQRFWKREWNASTYMFLFSRYFGLAALVVIEVLFNASISPEVCKKVVWLEPSMLMTMMLAAEVLLITRLWALWDRAMWIPCAFAVLLCAEIGLSAWSLVGAEPLPIPPQLKMSPCILHSTAKNMGRIWLFWLCPLITDSVIVILTIIRSYQLYVRAGRARVPLLTVFVRDGLIFYLVVLAAHLLNVIWVTTKPVIENQAFHSPLAAAVTSIAATRLSLIMRDPTYGEHSAASLSRYQSNKAGNACDYINRSDSIPTYPLCSLNTTDGSKDALGDCADEEKGLSQAVAPAKAYFRNESRDNDLRGYNGIYVKSQTSRNVAEGADQPTFNRQLFE